MVEVIIATMKPIIRAFGAQSKITRQSRAGIAPGTTFSAIPLNAGTISPINIRTPKEHYSHTYTEVDGFSEDISEDTSTSTSIAPYFSRNQSVCHQNKCHDNISNADHDRTGDGYFTQGIQGSSEMKIPQ